MLHRLIAVFLYMVALFSLCFSLYALIDLLNPEDSDSTLSTRITLLVAFGLLAFFSSRKAWKHQRQAKENDHEKLEKTILRIIAQHAGRTTPEEIALATTLTVQRSVLYLDKLCQQGSGGKQLTEKGNIVYVFRGFLSVEEKQTAKDVMIE